eukprot:COSAG01_NODE_7651_length_3113_cov_14.784672_1_plen_145_part_10
MNANKISPSTNMVGASKKIRKKKGASKKAQSKAATKIQSKWRKRKAAAVKKCETKACKVEGRQAFKSYLASFTINNSEDIQGFKGFDLLRRFRPTLLEFINKHKGIKYYPSVQDSGSFPRGGSQSYLYADLPMQGWWVVDSGPLD